MRRAEPWNETGVVPAAAALLGAGPLLGAWAPKAGGGAATLEMSSSAWSGGGDGESAGASGAQPQEAAGAAHRKERRTGGDLGRGLWGGPTRTTAQIGGIFILQALRQS